MWHATALSVACGSNSGKILLRKFLPLKINISAEANLRVNVLQKVKTILYFFGVIHQLWLMKCIFAENGRILEKSTKGA